MKHQCVTCAVVVVSLGGMAVGCASVEQPSPDPTDQGFLVDTVDQSLSRARTSRATINDASGNVIGRVAFASSGGATLIAVDATLPPAPESIHGFHVHANTAADGGPGAGCVADPAQPATTHFVSVGGHFNPGGAIHGGHAGDMPALFIGANGKATMVFTTDRFTPADVIGRAVILHAAPDNYGNIPVGTLPTQYMANAPDAITLTNNTGNAGVRIGCGVIQ